MFTIGYLARICPDKGLHNLVAAAELLAADPAAAAVSHSARPAIWPTPTGPIWRRSARPRRRAWADRRGFEYVGELTRAEKIAFLQSLDCLSLPTVYRESKGLSVLEAWPTPCRWCCPSTARFPS